MGCLVRSGHYLKKRILRRNVGIQNLKYWLYWGYIICNVGTYFVHVDINECNYTQTHNRAFITISNRALNNTINDSSLTLFINSCKLFQKCLNASTLLNNWRLSIVKSSVRGHSYSRSWYVLSHYECPCSSPSLQNTSLDYILIKLRPLHTKDNIFVRSVPNIHMAFPSISPPKFRKNF
jgi:hypothetical protein